METVDTPPVVTKEGEKDLKQEPSKTETVDTSPVALAVEQEQTTEEGEIDLKQQGGSEAEKVDTSSVSMEQEQTTEEGEIDLKQQPGSQTETVDTSPVAMEQQKGKDVKQQPSKMETVLTTPVVTESEEEEKDLKQKLTKTEKMLERTTRLLERSHKYNEELRVQIERLSSELHAYRSTAQDRVEKGCQADENGFLEAFGDKPFPDWGTPSDTAQQTSEGGGAYENNGSSVSIADTLKAAAQEQVWEQAGFVYDSASGLYYDYNSGYYYDSARSLYYEPNSTAYYYYDEAEQTYKFHSYATGGQHGEQTIQASGEHGTGEATDASQNTSSTPSGCSEKKSSREKSHKQKHKEKPKIKKGKIHKARRRTKSGKRKWGPKMEENQDTGKDGAVTSPSQNGVILVEDSGEGEKKEKARQKNAAEEPEAMECDDSSDSLATGESEMESDPESGELTEESSSTSSSSSSSSDDNNLDVCADPVHYDPSSVNGEAESEISANYPPCIRVVVQSSDAVDVGTFFLVTCPGGTVGRDSDSRHAIHIPDVNISKVHAEIKYDDDNSCYTVEDLGSQNGTFINDLRISQSKERSAAIPLSHGDVLGVAGTHMLLHIHPGTDTCDDCEPGQVLAALRAQQAVFNDHVVLTKNERKKQARQQLKEIKKKYGLANSAYVDNVQALNHPDYADKAELRRRYVGSEHPSHQKPQEAPASVHRPISSENKGHRMLAKMGWREGSGLGKDNTGRAEPVTVELRAQQTAGLGSTSSVSVSLDNVQSSARLRRLAQTQERFQRLEHSRSASQKAHTQSATLDHIQSGGRTSTVSAAAARGGNYGTRRSAVGSGRGGGSGAGVGDGDSSQNGGRPGKGPSTRGPSNRMQIKWIQGQTQNAT